MVALVRDSIMQEEFYFSPIAFSSVEQSVVRGGGERPLSSKHQDDSCHKPKGVQFYVDQSYIDIQKMFQKSKLILLLLLIFPMLLPCKYTKTGFFG